MDIYEKVVEGNYIDNLIREQKEQERTRAEELLRQKKGVKCPFSVSTKEQLCPLSQIAPFFVLNCSDIGDIIIKIVLKQKCSNVQKTIIRI